MSLLSSVCILDCCGESNTICSGDESKTAASGDFPGSVLINKLLLTVGALLSDLPISDLFIKALLGKGTSGEFTSKCDVSLIMGDFVMILLSLVGDCSV